MRKKSRLWKEILFLPGFPKKCHPIWSSRLAAARAHTYDPYIYEQRAYSYR